MEFTSRQTEIVEKAIGIISKSGIEGLTTKSLAGQVGVSEAALYRHFSGKSDILMGILDYFETRTRTLIDMVLQENISGLEKIHQILKRRSDEFIADPALMVIILSEEMFPGDSGLTAKVRGIMQLNRETIIRLIGECQLDGTIRSDIDKETIFNLVLGPFRFLMTRWRLSNFSFGLAAEFGNYWKAINKILGE
jgi:AcrR family transcriptional regulator